MSQAFNDETRPLLVEDAEDQRQPAEGVVLPRIPSSQIFVMSAVRIFEPIAFSQIFPYINEFVSDLHVTDDPKRIGFYSGLVESTLAIFQLLSIFNLAGLSDRIGRRPVILICCTCLGITTILFGLSTSLPVMLGLRALAGLFSGTGAVFHSVLGEITDSGEQAKRSPSPAATKDVDEDESKSRKRKGSDKQGLGIAVYVVTWSAGCVLGPLLGGLLARPVDKWAWIDYPVFRNFPYFLPGAVAGLMMLVGAVIGYFFLQETWPKKRLEHAKKMQKVASRPETPSSYGTLLPCENPEPEPAPAAPVSQLKTARMLLAYPVIRGLCGSGFALDLLANGFQVIFVLFCFSEVKDGGLGVSTELIGYLLSMSGLLSIAGQLVLLPTLLRVFDPARMYHLCMMMYPLIFVLMAVLNPIARAGWEESDGGEGRVGAGAMMVIWAIVGAVLVLTRFTWLAYSLSILLVKEHVPSPDMLGTTNGLVQVTMCFSRATGPFLVSSLYAFSVDKNILGGFAWVLVMVLVSFWGIWESSKIARAGR